MPADKSYAAKLKEAFSHYINTRTHEKKGAIDYLLTQPAPSQETILLNHNDYLGLASHPKIIEAQMKALNHQKINIMMSGVFLSMGSSQFDLEQKLADYVGMDKGCVFQSGLCANLSVAEALTDLNTTAYIDQRAHASLWLGLVLTKAKIIPFRHNNPIDLETKIQKFGAGPIFIDSVYSAQGTIAPIHEIVQIKKAHQCFLVVDESHSLGLFGDKGSGLVSELGLTSDVDCVTASLSKSFCTRAGLVSGGHEFMLYMKEKSTSMIFSSAVPNYDIARIEAMLALFMSEEGAALRNKLFELCAQLRAACIDKQYRLCSAEVRSPIVSIFCGEELDCRRLRLAFDSKNIYLAPFFQPATPPKETLLRMTINSGISDLQYTYIVEALDTVKLDFFQQNSPHPAFY